MGADPVERTRSVTMRGHRGNRAPARSMWGAVWGKRRERGNSCAGPIGYLRTVRTGLRHAGGDEMADLEDYQTPSGYGDTLGAEDLASLGGPVANSENGRGI